MTTQMRIELNHDGFVQLLCSEEISQECAKAAQSIASAAGGDFEVSDPRIVNYNGGRVSYLVYSNNYDDWVAESEYKVLTKAVHG